MIYLLILVLSSVSCQYEIRNNSSKIRGKSDSGSIKNYIQDTLFFELSSDQPKYIGERIFPSSSLSSKQLLDEVERTGVVLILKTIGDTIFIVLKNEYLFTSHVDSLLLKYLKNKEFLTQNGYLVDSLDEPRGAILLSLKCDNIMLLERNASYELESFEVCSEGLLQSIVLGGNTELKAFLGSHGINLQLELNASKIILVNIQRVNGSWFTELKDKGCFPMKIDISNEILFQYELNIVENKIRSLQISNIIGY